MAIPHKPSRHRTGRFGVFDFIQYEFRLCTSNIFRGQKRGGFGDAVDADGVEYVIRFSAKKWFHWGELLGAVGVEVPVVFCGESDQVGFIRFDVDAV